MRHNRVKTEHGGCYHAISRIIDRVFRLTDSEKAIFYGLMLRCASFSGVHILTYCLMDNHFHLLVDIPASQGVLDEQELIRRIKILYREEEVEERLAQWEQWRKEGNEYLVERDHQLLRNRMGDISEFMKTLKQRYSISYNSRHIRKGTLWEARFKSIVVEGVHKTKSKMGAYIDLNAVRAGIVADPKDYPWCGYGAACAGNSVARAGLMAIYGVPDDDPKEAWEYTSDRYRQELYIVGEEEYDATGTIIVRRGFKREEVAKVIAERGKLPLIILLYCRNRYFSDGMAFGSKAFCERIYNENRDHFGAKRKDGARKMKYGDWGELRTLRDLRVNAVTVSPLGQV